MSEPEAAPGSKGMVTRPRPRKRFLRAMKSWYAAPSTESTDLDIRIPG